MPLLDIANSSAHNSLHVVRTWHFAENSRGILWKSRAQEIVQETPTTISLVNTHVVASTAVTSFIGMT